MTDVELRKEEYGFNDLEVEEDPHVELEVVEGQPDWRRVSADDSIYYFNVATRESAWSLDETTTDRSEQ